MLYGPYVRLEGGPGAYDAFWYLKVDEPCRTSEKVVMLTVYDPDKKLLLGTHDVQSTDWGGRVHEYIEAKISFNPLDSDLNDRYEFRVHWYGKCNMTLQKFGVRKEINHTDINQARRKTAAVLPLMAYF